MDTQDAETATSIPRTIEDLGIPVAMVQDEVLRLAFVEGRTSTVRLSERLAINPIVMTPIIEQLRDLKLLEVIGLEGRDYQLTLTEEGSRQAKERMQLCRYTGAAPVSLDSVSRRDRHAQHAALTLDIDSLRRAFADLTVRDGLLAEIGPAVMGRGAMYHLRPPGNGQRRASPSGCAGSTTTMCSCPTPSRSTARSSRSSTRSSTHRHPSSPSTSIPAGCSASGRSSRWAAS
ncbi:MAG: hypothetical protein U5R31_04075 [Acidimicrobiia bacterium]|nr:hypothetical protein [Acidimicrobiia bacterium]